MSKVTGLLKELKRDSELVKATDYENGFVQEIYEGEGEIHLVDYFEGKAHCITNRTAGTQYTRSGMTKFKAGQSEQRICNKCGLPISRCICAL